MTIKSAGYIVTDNELIHGTGATADEAWADAMATLRIAMVTVLGDDDDSSEQQGSWMREADLRIRSAIPGLLRDVDERGGDCGWYSRCGVACTRDEAHAP